MIGICILNNMMLIEYCPCHVKGDKSSKKSAIHAGFRTILLKRKQLKYGVVIISKQLACQKFIFKIHSSRLRKARWNLSLPIDEARRNEEVISLADSQVLRWIDELNGITEADGKARQIKTNIKRIKKEPNSAQNKREIRK